MGLSSANMQYSSSPITTSLVILRLIVVFGLCYRTKGIVKLPPNVTVPAVIAFGDSIVDSGNNNNLKTLVKCNFPPYGKDFQGGVPSGRFCNGKIPSDLLVEEFGIKEYLPAYLDPNLKSSDLLTGVCFASGASGYDPLTPQIASVIPLAAQIEMFKEYIGKLKGIVGEERANYIIANTLYVVVAGSDDIANTYFVAHARPLYDIPSYTDLMVNGASNFIKEIYKLGARRMAVLGAPPIGCVPSQRTLAGGLARECSEKYNYAAKLFNSKFSKEIDSINRNVSPNTRIVYIDVYNPLLDIILNYQNYGYKVVDRGCCGTGKLEVAVLCNPLDSTCADPSQYVFWDSYHPTESVYRVLIRAVLQKYLHRLL